MKKQSLENIATLTNSTIANDNAKGSIGGESMKHKNASTLIQKRK